MSTLARGVSQRQHGQNLEPEESTRHVLWVSLVLGDAVLMNDAVELVAPDLMLGV